MGAKLREDIQFQVVALLYGEKFKAGEYLCQAL